MSDATDSGTLLAIDGNSLVHRAFHSQAATGLRSPDGSPIWAVRGLLSQIVSAVERIGPDVVLVGFDDPAASLRRERWPQYKATRVDKLGSLVEQLESAQQVLRDMGVAVVVPPGLEADDVLASAARSRADAGGRTVIVTSDRDSFALIDQYTSVLRIINGGVEASPLLTPERLVTLLGVAPGQYRDFAALRGDASDNLPGVRGVGPKTAAKLLAALGDARTAFDDVAGDGDRVLAAVGPGALARLREPAARAAWELNCAVMAMHVDVELGLRPGAPGGAGRLPLPVEAVRRAFADLQLTWTARTALRVLAHHAESDAAPVTASAPARDYGSERSWRGAWSPRITHPKLPAPRAPASVQLTLFE